MIAPENIQNALDTIGSEIKLADADYKKPFKEIGLDSLEVFNLLTELEVMTGKQISDEDFSGLITLNDIIDHLNS
jgi:acyl carrier protein